MPGGMVSGRTGSCLRFRPPKKIGPNLGKPPPERSGGLHNAPTVTLPACYFASTARRYLPSSAYFAYALQIGKPYSFSEEEITLCREKLWNDGLFNRTW